MMLCFIVEGVSDCGQPATAHPVHRPWLGASLGGTRVPGLRVMTYNIYEGAEGREEPLLEVLRAAEPDLLLLQEVVDEESARWLAGLLGMNLVFASSNARTRNVALLSRLPVAQAQAYHPFPLFRTLLLATVLLPSGDALNLYGTHLGLLHDLWRVWEVAVILRRIRAYERAHPAAYSLLAGDFNSVAPGEPVELEGQPSLLKLVLALQFKDAPRLALRLVTRAGWRDCYRLCHASRPGLTMPASRPAARLDYIFAIPPLASPSPLRCPVRAGGYPPRLRPSPTTGRLCSLTSSISPPRCHKGRASKSRRPQLLPGRGRTPDEEQRGAKEDHAENHHIREPDRPSRQQVP
jgi:endonuclease/exonuclease/phosphatase family metal-dependent hydrolase